MENEGNHVLMSLIDSSSGPEFTAGTPPLYPRSTGRRSGSTWYQSSFLIINATLGAGLLNFPQAYDRAGGILTATVMMSVLLIFIFGALLILAHCSLQTENDTYQDVVFRMLGVTGQQICSAAIAVYMFGACVTYLVVIGDQVDRVLASLYGRSFCHYWYMNRVFTLPVCAIVFILPMCFSRRIDFLRYPSALGVVAVLYFVFLIIYKYCIVGNTAVPVKTSPSHWSDIFLAVPAICFGFQCHISSVPIYSCLQDRNLRTFTKSILLALLFSASAYSLVAIFGYLTFGVGVASDILLMYDASDGIVILGIIMLVIKTIVAYPVLSFCGRLSIEGLWRFLKRKLSPTNLGHNESRQRIIISCTWFFLTLAIAVFTPNIGTVIQPLGSLAALMIFNFPGLCLLKSTIQKDPHLYLLKDRLVLLVSVLYQLIGAFLFGVSLVQLVTTRSNLIPVLLCV